ncbi:uncharacterized protein A4U43_C04F29620 [Asparagus officinalis]|uniref:Uncharacterized protein n=1 Tax=Asparagus officinalis TaxID=4686 RepID=A0A5P1F6D9_ASPOF|nr:uncharacterized protein A4U43_C04F29620 [Asparagus officinalis]
MPGAAAATLVATEEEETSFFTIELDTFTLGAKASSRKNENRALVFYENLSVIVLSNSALYSSFQRNSELASSFFLELNMAPRRIASKGRRTASSSTTAATATSSVIRPRHGTPRLHMLDLSRWFSGALDLDRRFDGRSCLNH